MRLRQNLAMIGLASAGVLALAGCSGSALTSACEDYYEFDQEYSSQMQSLMTTATAADADEESLQEVNAVMSDASAEYHAMVENAEDETFVAEAQKTLPMFEAMETMADPDASADQKAEAAQTVDFNQALEAEQNLIDMCDAELN